MAGYRNSFRAPAYQDHSFVDDEGVLIGILRVKPSGLLWRANGKHRFRRVTLNQFTAWIGGGDAGAVEVNS